MDVYDTPLHWMNHILKERFKESIVKSFLLLKKNIAELHLVSKKIYYLQSKKKTQTLE